MELLESLDLTLIGIRNELDRWWQAKLMAPTEARRDEADLHASDSYGEFSKEFIAEVLEAENEGKTGLCKRFESVDDLLASLDE